jgi:simple sugar transport system ATP-binding protein
MTNALLEARGLRKRFGHVEALRGANFCVYPGEVVALVGDNGAGKSTLVKSLSGTLQPDDGEILFEGTPVRLDGPHAAQALGIETVYQDLALAPDLDPAANLYLGREIRRGGLAGKLGLLDKKAMRIETARIFSTLNVNLQRIDTPVANLSGGQQQGVAVGRAVAWANRVLFLDEPTAALGVVQTQNVLDLIRRVRDRGLGVVLVSHSMPDVCAVADRAEVFRLGRRAAVLADTDISLQNLVAAMTGALITEPEC